MGSGKSSSEIIPAQLYLFKKPYLVLCAGAARYAASQQRLLAHIQYYISSVT